MKNNRNPVLQTHDLVALCQCPDGMHRCTCGLPRCIERNKVGDGIKHCQDGSDEGEDTDNHLCPESSAGEDPFEVEMKKRQRRNPRKNFSLFLNGISSEIYGRREIGELIGLDDSYSIATNQI
ncbi:hypothetical protein AVEN_255579-1 [Araneus ventricosus]|uniref:EGF-like domain-containing protein n=1 Tax=Araneus ventricosus TaxID=182803 RepID=A0A4Y2KVA6_ARAVE|nr:hypothetical protein AVEN_255579-1 [Araneus ventricosus]